MSGGSSDCNVVCISSLVLTTVLASPACITSRSRVYFGCCSSNLSTCISVTALSWMLVSSAMVRNLTTLLPLRLLLQFAAPTRAAPATPTPLSLRKSLRLIALGICPSLGRSPCQWKRFTIEVCPLAQAATSTTSDHSYREGLSALRVSLGSRESYDWRSCRAPTWIKRMLLTPGSPARFSGALASLRSGIRARPQRDVGWLHRPPHDPARSSLASASPSAGDIDC